MTDARLVTRIRAAMFEDAKTHLARLDAGERGRDLGPAKTRHHLSWAINEIERLRGRLAELEWAGLEPSWWPEVPACCPVCKGLKEGPDAGHRSPDEHDEQGCWLAAELGS